MMTDKVMNKWIATFERHPEVVTWLRKNPPPPDWHGTPMQWAYTEMPTLLFTKGD